MCSNENETLTVSGSSFTGNKAWLADLSRDGGICGGALYITSSSDVSIKSSTFDHNVSNMHGGAICVNGTSKSFLIQQCSITNNIAGGEASTYDSVNDGSSDYLSDGRTAAHAGAIFLVLDGDNTNTYTFASTTIAGNSCTQAGGVMLVDGGSASNTINFVDCTITNNSTTNNAGNNGGICCTGKSGVVNFVNTILEGNWSYGSDQYADCWFTTTPAKFYNSVVGYMFEYDTYASSYTIDDNSLIQTTPSKESEMQSGVNRDYSVGGYYPLEYGSKGASMYSSSASSEYGVSLDQTGHEFSKCIGAVERVFVPVVIDETGYVSRYYSDVSLIVPEGVKAITYSSISGSTLSEGQCYEAGEVVPSSTGVVLAADDTSSEQTYYILQSFEEGTEATGNMLYGSDEDATTVAPDESEYKFYKLSLDANNTEGTLGFYYGTADGGAFTSKAHRAYLAVPAGLAGGAKGFVLSGGELTAISSASIGESPVNATVSCFGKRLTTVYDISGRKVSDGKQPLSRGLYIQNGKKIVINK